jgi:hypothetical protein
MISAQIKSWQRVKLKVAHIALQSRSILESNEKEGYYLISVSPMKFRIDRGNMLTNNNQSRRTRRNYELE